MTMRIIWLVFLLGMQSNLSFAQSTSPAQKGMQAPIVSTAVSSVTVNDGVATEYRNNYDVLAISLTVTITNRNEVPLLLLSRRVNFAGVEIARNLDEFLTASGAFSVYYLASSATFVDERMWKANKQDLDTAKPDEIKILVLPGGESLNYLETIRMNLPKSEDDRFKFAPWKNYSLAELNQFDTIYLRLRNCDLLNYGITRKQKKRFDFASGLRDRWRSFGTLWLGDCDCEPFRLDLSSAVDKTR